MYQIRIIGVFIHLLKAIFNILSRKDETYFTVQKTIQDCNNQPLERDNIPQLVGSTNVGQSNPF